MSQPFHSTKTWSYHIGIFVVSPDLWLVATFPHLFPNKALTITPDQNLRDGFDPVDFLVNLDQFQVHHPEIVSSQVSKDFAGQLTSNPQNIDPNGKLWSENSEEKKCRFQLHKKCLWNWESASSNGPFENWLFFFSVEMFEDLKKKSTFFRHERVFSKSHHFWHKLPTLEFSNLKQLCRLKGSRSRCFKIETGTWITWPSGP